MICTTHDNKIILEFDIGNYNKDIVDFLTVMEITNKSKASDSDIDKLAYDVKNSWWNKNKDRLLNETNN